MVIRTALLVVLGGHLMQKHFRLKLKKKWKLNEKWKKSKYITGIVLILAIVQMAMIFDGVC